MKNGLRPQGCSGLLVLGLALLMFSVGCNSTLNTLHKIPVVNKLVPPQSDGEADEPVPASKKDK